MTNNKTEELDIYDKIGFVYFNREYLKEAKYYHCRFLYLNSHFNLKRAYRGISELDYPNNMYLIEALYNLKMFFTDAEEKNLLVMTHF